MAPRKPHARASRKPGPRTKSGTRGKPTPADAPRIQKWVEPLLIFVAAFVVYIPALDGIFVWDDVYSIRNNRLLTDVEGLWQIWTTVGRIALENHYWPLTYTVLWLEWQCWGAWQPGFHLVNMLVNAAIVVQIWRLTRRVGLPGGALAALLFALHPVHVEAVAWMISLKDLMATGCYLVAVECYLNHEERGGFRWLVATAGVAAAAMLFKSTPITLPAGLAILLWYRRGRIGTRELAQLALIGAVVASIAVADVWVNRAALNAASEPPRLTYRLAQAGWSFWLYVGKLLWPARLSAIYPQWQLDPGRALEWLPLAAMAAVTAALWIWRRRIGRGPLACWLFYIATLGPVLGIQYFNFLGISPIADRYQYLASAAPIIGIGVLAGRFFQAHRFEARAWVCAASAIVLALLATLTWRKEAHFHDPEKLFAQAAAVAPRSIFAHFNLGCAYLEMQQYADAERAFAQTVDLKPDYWDAVCNLQSTLCLEAKYREAAEVCRDAIARGCKHPGVLNNFAEIKLVVNDPSLHDPVQALELARQSLEGKGGDDPYYIHVYAKAQLVNGMREEGIATARKALERARAIGAKRLIPQIEATLRNPDQKSVLGRGEIMFQ